MLCYNIQKRAVCSIKKTFLYFVIIILALNLSSCQTTVDSIDKETFARSEYYTTDNSIYFKSGDITELICKEEKNIDKLCMLDGEAYYSISEQLDYNFEIKRITKGGKCIETLITGENLLGEQLTDWEICDRYILFTVNTNLYRYSIANSTTELLHNDVSTFEYYDGFIYFSEHASRTFTIYKMEVDNGVKEVVLGNGIYDKEKPKELISNFIITDNGDIVYTQRVPYGLFVYSDKKTELIESTDSMGDIDEYNLVYDNGNVYYVLRTEETVTLCCYTDAKERKEIAKLRDYSRLLSVENGCYTYENTYEQVITKAIQN